MTGNTAFSDGVLAIIITIMVLELRAPQGHELPDLAAATPTFLSYALSFIYVALYWLNHHHLLYAAERVNGAILWANIVLLFFLSLMPFSTAWLGATHGSRWPTIVYGASLLAPAIAYYVLQSLLINAHGRDHALKRAVGGDAKGIVSLLIYVVGLATAALADPLWAQACFAFVALLWVVPDQRIERELSKQIAPDTN